MKKTHFIILLFIFGIGSLSLVGLDGDPAPLKQVADLMDETAWAHNARSKVLFGSYFTPPDDFGYGLLGAPLFTFLLRYLLEIGGCNLFTLRLLSVFSFWGVLFIIYKLFINYGFSKPKSLLPVFILGTNHQALIHARWGTPIFLEIFFLTLSFALLTYACSEDVKNRASRTPLFFSGISFGAAIASRLSAANMIPAYFLSMGLLVYPFKQFKTKQLRPLFMGGFAVSVILTGFYAYYQKYMKILTYVLALPGPDSSDESLTASMFHVHPFSLLKVLGNEAFANPMVFILMSSAIVLLGLRFIQCLELHQTKKRLLHWNILDKIELLAFFWLIFGLLTFGFYGKTPYRRFILFLVPLSILFSKLIFTLDDLYRKNKNNTLGTYKFWEVTKKITVSFILVSSFIFYIPKAGYFIDQTWLLPLGKASFFSFSYSSLYFLLCPLAILLIYSCGYRALSIALIALLTLSNLSLSIHWIIRPTFTLREESRRLAKSLSSQDMGTGHFPWILLFETPALPIWHHKIGRHHAFNSHFPGYILEQKRDLILFQNISNISDGSTLYGKYELSPEDFPTYQTIPIGDFKMAPFPGTSVYRIQAKVSRLSPRIQMLN